MRPSFKRTLLGAVAALSLSLGSPAMAADHRDAPTIDDFSAIDINDVYVFRDPSNCTPGPGCNLVVALSTQAVADPLFGSSYHFQPNALYSLFFTTRKEPHPTARIDFVFGPFQNGTQTFTAFFPHGVVLDGTATQGTPNSTHLVPTINQAGDIKIFAGPREDPFFFDLVGFNRATGAGGSSNFASNFTGVDAFKGKNVNAIVLEFPASMVFPSGSCISSNPQLPLTPCGVWAETFLGDFKSDDLKNLRAHDENAELAPGDLTQVDRMGNPAVNTVLIPAAFKDAFNFGQPQRDAKDFAGIILKQILTLDQKFGSCPPTATSATSCNPNVALLASLAVPDILRFANNVPDGYPNGRRPEDRTTDLLLGLIVNPPESPGVFTDGTSTKFPCSVFPFLRPPLQLGSTQLNPQICP
jgi:Domain of unknown function (DUF4331)